MLLLSNFEYCKKTFAVHRVIKVEIGFRLNQNNTRISVDALLLAVKISRPSSLEEWFLITNNIVLYHKAVISLPLCDREVPWSFYSKEQCTRIVLT